MKSAKRLLRTERTSLPYPRHERTLRTAGVVPTVRPIPSIGPRAYARTVMHPAEPPSSLAVRKAGILCNEVDSGLRFTPIRW